MTKEITGKWEFDGYGWRNVYADNTIWIENLKKHTWESVAVGDRIAFGSILTQKTYDKWESECNNVGTFVIE